MTEYENRYPIELLDEYDDDGTITENLRTLEQLVVGHKIVAVERTEKANDYWGRSKSTYITLDNGTRVKLVDTNDCCAYTTLESFLLNVDSVDHAILGVGTTEGYTKWHIYADLGDMLELTVGWSCGNPFYYGYGFDIAVEAIPENNVKDLETE